MVEFISFATAIGVLFWLVRPFFRGRPLPAWLERARLRGRPGVPVTAWLVALLLMFLTWLIGDQRGIVSFLLWLIWIGGPMVACWLTWLWLRRKKSATDAGTAHSP